MKNLVTITKKFTFEAAHSLPDSGKCSELHGHSYKLFVSLKGEVQEDGMIINFSVLNSYVDTYIIDKCDHKNLNIVAPFDKINATAENMVMYFATLLADKFKQAGFTQVHAVKVTLFETEKCSAEYEVAIGE